LFVISIFLLTVRRPAIKDFRLLATGLSLGGSTPVRDFNP